LRALNHFETLAFSGLGDEHAEFNVYLANRPPMPEFTDHDGVLPLRPGDIYRIGQETGNHWRKIFNVYAKLLFELAGKRTDGYATWQAYRDECMLQAGSGVALIYGAPENHPADIPEEGKGAFSPGITLIMGKQFADDSDFWKYDGLWINADFAINSKGWILCPYFDYRQLSNIKIATLVSIIKSHL
jgi:hypothetical protein